MMAADILNAYRTKAEDTSYFIKRHSNTLF